MMLSVDENTPQQQHCEECANFTMDAISKREAIDQYGWVEDVIDGYPVLLCSECA